MRSPSKPLLVVMLRAVPLAHRGFTRLASLALPGALPIFFFLEQPCPPPGFPRWSSQRAIPPRLRQGSQTVAKFILSMIATFSVCMPAAAQTNTQTTPLQRTQQEQPLAQQQGQTAGTGLSRDQILEVQQELLRKGYYSGPVDGIFGPKTCIAGVPERPTASRYRANWWTESKSNPGGPASLAPKGL
jgi:hypothetical protein